MFYKMDVFTNLIGPVAVPLLNIYNEKYFNKNNATEGTTKGLGASVTAHTSSGGGVVEGGGGGGNTQNLNFLNNLSTEELNVLLQKYFSFDYSDDSSSKVMEWFMILLFVPCVTMFCVLITQNIGIILKLFIAFLTIVHVVIVTFYIHNTFHHKKLNNTTSSNKTTQQSNAMEKYS